MAVCDAIARNTRHLVAALLNYFSDFAAMASPMAWDRLAPLSFMYNKSLETVRQEIAQSQPSDLPTADKPFDFSADGKTLLSSSDDRTLKLWDAREMKERRMFEKQPDWTPAVVFLGPAKVAVGRLDGTIGLYDINSETALKR